MIRKQFIVAMLACLAMLLAAIPAFAQSTVTVTQQDIGIQVVPAYTYEPPPPITIAAKDPHKDHGWDADTSHTECGGLRRDGKPQPPCDPARATYLGPAKAACDAGYNFDIITWTCNKCPPNFEQTLAGVNTDRACSRKAAVATGPAFMPARFIGPLCPNADATHEKAFYDSIRGGECWACPKGYNTNVLPRVDAGDKCTRPVRQSFKSAIRKKNSLTPFGCDGDTFWDIWDGGACWSCPSTYEKVVFNPVYSDQKCMHVDPAVNSYATVVGTGKCEDGTMTDIRNGGECWKCPPSYDNVILEPVTSQRKCQTTPSVEFAKMQSQVALTCPAGQVFDFIAVDAGRLAQLKSDKAAANNAPTSGSGTCWQCPPDTKRTMVAINEPNSCQGDIYIEWYSAKVDQPGLFGLKGRGEAVVLEMLHEDYDRMDKAVHGIVDGCAKSSAGTCAGDEAQQAAELWAEIRNTPGASALLQNMALGRIELAVSGGATPADVRPPTDADRQLATSFASYVQGTRIRVAEESLKAYDAWADAKKYWGDWGRQAQLRDQQNKEGKNGAAIAVPTGIGDLFPPPPDWNSIIQGAMINSVVGAVALTGGVIATVSKSPELAHWVRPGLKIRARIAERAANKELLDLGERTAQKLTTKLTGTTVEKTAGKAAAEGTTKALSKLAPKVLKFLKATGPAMVIGIVVDVVIDIVMTLDENSKTSREHLLAKLAEAKQPVDLQRLFSTDEGTAQAETYWILAMTGLSDPDAATAAKIAALVDSKGKSEGAAAGLSSSSTAGTAAPAGNTWKLLPGAANDIGAGGALWIVGNDSVPGGHTVWRWAGSTWQKIAGGGMRIDVDAQGNAWLVNDAGALFRWNGSAWAGLPGKVSDIGVGADGSAWAIGVEAVPGGSKVYRWNGNDWQSVDGGAVRVDVDPHGNAWLVNDVGAVFRWTGNGWAGVAGIQASDVGIGGDGSVFALDKAGGVYKWSGSAWVRRDGVLSNITADPKGVPYGVNPQKQVWMGSP